MKTLAKLLFFAAFLGLLTNCAKDEIIDESANELKSGIPPEVNNAQGLDQDRFIIMDEIDLKVHYRIIGKGPVDIVFITAWTNPLTAYTKQFDYFREKARCIYIDLPGHGLSDSPEGIEYTLQLNADAIYDVLKKEGVHKFVAVGSNSAPIVIGQFERQYPGMITQLVTLAHAMSDPWPKEGPARDARIAAYQNNILMYESFNDDQKLAQLNMLIPPLSCPSDLIEWGKYFLVFPSWLMADMQSYITNEEACTPVPWNIPILAIYRTQPNMTRLNLFFPNCDLHVLPNGTSAVIQWQQHEAVNALIDDFIDRPGKKY